MKILLVNTSERIGGAAVAASRLMEALNNHGIKAKLLVRDKQTNHITVLPLKHSLRMKWCFLWERFTIWVSNRFSRNNLFSVDIANTGADITSLPEFQEADIIHLHWINQGMLSLKGIARILASGKPVVWTMHDMWPCTGICHHARKCTRYEKQCDHCPYLYKNGGRKDLSYRIFRKKKALLQRRSIHFVACSQWLEEQSKRSALLCGHPICNIPNPINTKIFHPQSKSDSIARCGLPKKKKFILFGSVNITDKRKGIDYLIAACKLLAKRYPELQEQLGIVVFGNHSEELEIRLPFKVYPMGFVNNERQLADIYNAVHLFTTPSLEENLPNMIMEAMACGVPCVGFHVGGIPEMIDHGKNGYVAQYKSSEDFANGIAQLLYAPNYDILSEQACRKATTYYSENVVAERYIELYQSTLNL